MPEDLIAKGRALYEGRRYAEALDVFDRAVEELGTAEGHYRRALALRRLNREKAALAAFDRAIELDPKVSDYHFDRGLTALHLGHEAEGRRDYDRAIELDPKSWMPRFNRAQLRTSDRDFRGAFEDYAVVVEGGAYPRDFRDSLYQNLKICAPAAEREDVERVYAVAIASHPNVADVHLGRGQARAKWGELEGAVQDLEQAVAADPKYWAPRELLVECYAKLGRPEAARPHADWLLQDPARASAETRALLERFASSAVAAESRAAAAKKKRKYESATGAKTPKDRLAIVAAVLRQAPSRATELESMGDFVSFANDLKRLGDSLEKDGPLQVPSWFLESM